MYGHKWWLCWKISVQCGRELNFLHSNCYYFTWSDNYFIQLETLLINHPSYSVNCSNQPFCLWSTPKRTHAGLKKLLKISYHWKLVLTLAFCAPWRWYTCTGECRRYAFNICIISTVHLVDAVNWYKDLCCLCLKMAAEPPSETPCLNKN